MLNPVPRLGDLGSVGFGVVLMTLMWSCGGERGK